MFQLYILSNDWAKQGWESKNINRKNMGKSYFATPKMFASRQHCIDILRSVYFESIANKVEAQATTLDIELINGKVHT